MNYTVKNNSTDSTYLIYVDIQDLQKNNLDGQSMDFSLASSVFALVEDHNSVSTESYCLACCPIRNADPPENQ